MREQIDCAIAGGEAEALAVLLDGAKSSAYRYAARRLSQACSPTESVLARAKEFAGRPEISSQHVACQLTSHAYAFDAAKSIALLKGLAGHDDWTVRDASSEVCGRLLRKDFAPMIERLRAWSSDTSVAVRRAVVIAAARAADERHPEWADPLLRLLEPLLSDRDPLLKRNLGPSALSSSLLQHYPGITFEYLTNWSTSNDAQMLWNVAMAFSGPAAAPMVKKAIIVLRKLSLDPRRYVWRAAASAMWKLGRKRPEIIRPELARWLEDERRTDVAREALRYL